MKSFFLSEEGNREEDGRMHDRRLPFAILLGCLSVMHQDEAKHVVRVEPLRWLPSACKRQGVKERVFGSYAKEACVSNARGKEVA